MQRFPPIPEAALDDDQRSMAARAAPTGPFRAFLRAPLVWEHLQPLRHYLASHSILGAGEREAAILMLAHHLGSTAAFEAHRPLAVAAGISAEAIDAIGAGANIGEIDLAPGVALAARVTHRLLVGRHLDDALYRLAMQRWSERGIVELIALIGFFTTIALTLNVMEAESPVSPADPAEGYSPADKN